MNPGFTKRIVGLKDEESEAILRLLFTVSLPLKHDDRISSLTNKTPSILHRVKTCRSGSNGRKEQSCCGTIVLRLTQVSNWCSLSPRYHVSGSFRADVFLVASATRHLSTMRSPAMPNQLSLTLVHRVAISDYGVESQEEGLRHGFRITTLGERPTGVNGLESVW